MIEVPRTSNIYDGEWMRMLCTHNSMMSGLTDSELATIAPLELDQINCALIHPEPNAPLLAQMIPQRMKVLMDRINSLLKKNAKLPPQKTVAFLLLE